MKIRGQVVDAIRPALFSSVVAKPRFMMANFQFVSPGGLLLMIGLRKTF
jgi:hypothetical protein